MTHLGGGPVARDGLWSGGSGEERAARGGKTPEVYLSPQVQGIVEVPAGGEGGQAHVRRVLEWDQHAGEAWWGLWCKVSAGWRW